MDTIHADRGSALLSRLCDDYWSFCCSEQPFNALVAGESMSEPALYRESPSDHDRRAKGAAALLKIAESIPVDGLTQQERISLSLIETELGLVTALHDCDAHLRPSLFPAGPDFNLTYLASVTPVTNPSQAEHFMALLETAPDYVKGLRESLALGYQKGYRQSQFALNRSALSIETNLREGFKGSILSAFERSTSGAKVANVRDRVELLLDDKIIPELEGLVSDLRGSLSKNARVSIGLSDELGGEPLYKTLCRQYTSTDLSPEAIHKIGLEEVQRIANEQRELAALEGYGDDLIAYRASLENTTCYFAADETAHLNAVRALCKRIDGQIPGFFGTLPRVSYGVDLIPAAQADSTPPAYAQPSPVDASRPGIFWLTPQVTKCPSYLYPSLALHEAWPGHLMQIALMQEQTSLPKFRRNGALKYTACIEGWAMYCEWLGEEMGIYQNSAERFGRLNMEMWRAVRLVLDTGIHRHGWDREQAVAYMAEHVALPRAAIESEVDRYIALPGQALAYQLGYRTMRKLRQKTQLNLGDDFDVRQFHDQVIRCGPLTLELLNSSIEQWVEQQRGAV